MQTANIEVVEALEVSVAPGIVRRSDRGLCIAGTKISLFSIMNAIRAGRTEVLLTYGGMNQEQFEQVLAYIEANREEFEAAYQKYVRDAEEMERDSRERERRRRAELEAQGLWRKPAPDLIPAWERLQALKREGTIG